MESSFLLPVDSGNIEQLALTQPELLDATAFARAMTLYASIMLVNKKSTEALSAFSVASSLSELRYKESLDTSLELDSDIILKDLNNDVKSLEAYTGLQNIFCSGALGSIKIGGISSEMMNTARGSGQGFLSKIRLGRSLGNLSMFIKVSPEQAAQTIYDCRLEVKQKLEKQYTALFLFGMGNLSRAPEGRRLHLPQFINNVCKQLSKIESDEYEDSRERFYDRSVVMATIAKKAMTVLDKGRFVTPDDRRNYQTLDTVVRRYIDWAEETAELDQDIENSMNVLFPLSAQKEGLSDTQDGVIVPLMGVDSTTPELTDESEAITNIEKRFGELLLKAGELREAHDAMISAWQRPSKRIKGLGLKDITHRLVVGVEGDGWSIDGQPAHEVADRLSAMITLYERSANGIDTELLKAKLEDELSLEERVEVGLRDISRELRQYRPTLEIGKLLPPLQGGLLVNLQWLRQNWEPLKRVLANDSVAKDYINPIADQLELSPALPQDTADSYEQCVQPIDLQVSGGDEYTLELNGGEFENDGGSDESDVPQDVTLGELIDLSLAESARQLDWEVFPKGTTLEEVERDVRAELHPGDAVNVEWQRLRDLKRLADMAGGELYRSRSRSLGSRPPYYVAVFHLGDKQFAVAENPIWGNASYVIREDLVDGTWKDVLEESRRHARNKGAVQVVHRKTGQHIERLLNSLQDILAVKTV